MLLRVKRAERVSERESENKIQERNVTKVFTGAWPADMYYGDVVNDENNWHDNIEYSPSTCHCPRQNNTRVRKREGRGEGRGKESGR